jgi:hypothetical protein
MTKRSALELDSLTIRIPIRLQRRGGRKLIMTPEGAAMPAPKPRPDETLVKALVRAHRCRRRIESGKAKSITDLAEHEGVTDAYVCRLLPLTCLAPDVVEAILNGRQPKGLRLAELLGNGPLAWEEQRRVTEVLEAHQRARELCRRVADPEQLSRAIYGIWLFTHRQGKFRSSVVLARELLTIVKHEQDSGLRLEAHHAMWTTGWNCGELETGRLHTELGLELYRPDEHHHLAGAYGGHDAGVCCRYASAMIALLQGYARAIVVSCECSVVRRGVRQSRTPRSPRASRS